MSQNVLTAAAREGGRVASMPSTLSDATVIAAVQDRLSRGGLNPSLITVDVDAPTTWANLNPGDKMTVSVSGAMSDLSWITYINILPNAKLSAEITYKRE